MKFKTDNLFMFVEGIQFLNGEYSTTDKNEIEILKRYADSISIVEEVKEPTVKIEEIEEVKEPSKKSKKSEEE